MNNEYEEINIKRFYPNKQGEFELVLGALVFACLDGACKQAEDEGNDSNEAIDFYTMQKLKYYIEEACDMMFENTITDFVKDFFNSRDIQLIYTDDEDE